MFCQKFLAHPRLVVEAVQRCLGCNLDQIAIALLVFRQHQKMVIGVVVRRRALNVVIVFLADVKLAADDWFDPSFVGGIYETDRAKNIAVVRHGYRRHAQFFDAIDKLLYVTGPVKHRIIGVQMEVDKLGHDWVDSFYADLILSAAGLCVTPPIGAYLFWPRLHRAKRGKTTFLELVLVMRR